MFFIIVNFNPLENIQGIVFAKVNAIVVANAIWKLTENLSGTFITFEQRTENCGKRHKTSRNKNKTSTPLHRGVVLTIKKSGFK